jgi:hypothetical protein
LASVETVVDGERRKDGELCFFAAAAVLQQWPLVGKKRRLPAYISKEVAVGGPARSHLYEPR